VFFRPYEGKKGSFYGKIEVALNEREQQLLTLFFGDRLPIFVYNRTCWLLALLLLLSVRPALLFSFSTPPLARVRGEARRGMMDGAVRWNYRRGVEPSTSYSRSRINNHHVMGGAMAASLRQNCASEVLLDCLVSAVRRIRHDVGVSFAWLCVVVNDAVHS